MHKLNKRLMYEYRTGNTWKYFTINNNEYDVDPVYFIDNDYNKYICDLGSVVVIKVLYIVATIGKEEEKYLDKILSAFKKHNKKTMDFIVNIFKSVQNNKVIGYIARRFLETITIR